MHAATIAQPTRAYNAGRGNTVQVHDTKQACTVHSAELHTRWYRSDRGFVTRARHIATARAVKRAGAAVQLNETCPNV
jgi:hypothetical protein